MSSEKKDVDVYCGQLMRLKFIREIYNWLTITRTTKEPMRAVRPTELKRMDAKV